MDKKYEKMKKEFGFKIIQKRKIKRTKQKEKNSN